MPDMRAVVKWFAVNNAVQPYIENDQTTNLIIRHTVDFFASDGSLLAAEIEITTKVSLTALPAVMKAAVCDSIRATALTLFNDPVMANADIIFPDLTRGT